MVVEKVDATGWLVCRGDRNNVGVLEYVEQVERVEREVAVVAVEATTPERVPVRGQGGRPVACPWKKCFTLYFYPLQ